MISVPTLAAETQCVIVERYVGGPVHGALVQYDPRSITLRPLFHVYDKKNITFQQRNRTFAAADIKNICTCQTRAHPYDLTSMAFTDRMSEFSIAYVQSIISVAGCTVAIERPDRRTYDLNIGSSYVGKKRDMCTIYAQVKSIAVPEPCPSQVPIRLSAKAYEVLRKTGDDTRILIVVTVPKPLDDWLRFSESSMGLSFRAYYYLFNKQEERNEEKPARVKVPLTKAFTPTVLSAMIRRIGDKGRLDARV